MKIGIYIDRIDLRGGAQRVVSNLCQGWARRGWEVHLIVASGGSPAFAVPAAVRQHSLAARHKRRGLLGAWDNWSHVRELGRVVTAAHLDAVLSVSGVANVHLALAKIPEHVVRIGSEHGDPGYSRLPAHKELFRRWLYPRLDALVCPTKEAADCLLRAYPGTRTRGIHNWLTWPLPRSVGSSTLTARRSPERKIFVACGRLDKLKGFRNLITMFAGVSNRLPDWDLIIMGEGEDRPQLEALVKKAGLADRISLPGWVADVGAIYRDGDLFLFPSFTEGFALVLAESMACGLPCLSYDCKVGPSEIIRDGVDGVLISVGDEKAFMAAMVRLAEDESTRRKFASACQEVLARFSEEAIQPHWDDLLRRKR